MFSNKTADKVAKVSTSSPDNSSETFESENIEFDRGTPKERYITPEKRPRIIDKLRLI